MKILLSTALFFTTIGLCAQDLNSTIDSLFWSSSGEKPGDRIPTARRILEIDSANPYAHEYIVESYRLLNQYQKAYSYIDSILSKPNPNPVVALSLANGLGNSAPKDSTYDSYYFKLLRICLKSLETKTDAAYFLSQAYYSDFIAPYKKQPPTFWRFAPDTTFDQQFAEEPGISVDSFRRRENQIKPPETVYQNSADSALKYLKVLAFSESSLRQVVRIPIAQLEKHLGISDKFEIDSSLYNNHYFPEWYFGYLSKDWPNDLSTDLFNEMVFSSFNSVDFLSKQLDSLNEPILYPKTEKLTFRISWLPKFHPPIVIRVIKNESGGKIIWKVGSSKRGDQPFKKMKEGEYSLNTKEFYEISEVLNNANICSALHYDYRPVFGGTRLILEKVNKNQFCAHQTNAPDESIKNLLAEIAEAHFSEIETGIEGY